MITTHLSIRRASLADVDFVVTAIREAERSGGQKTTYERLFELEPAALDELLRRLLAEELPGSELSCDSFLLALDGAVPVGGCAAWVEGREAPSSRLVRTNLLAFTFGEERWRQARPRLAILAPIDLGREPNTLQIESLYVARSHRGRGVARALIDFAIDACRAAAPQVGKAQIQSVIENRRSAATFAGAGFAVTREVRSEDPALGAIFPGSGRRLWERGL